MSGCKTAGGREFRTLILTGYPTEEQAHDAIDSFVIPDGREVTVVAIWNKALQTPYAWAVVDSVMLAEAR